MALDTGRALSSSVYVAGVLLCQLPGLQPIERALGGEWTAVQDVGVDHGRADVAVAEELLDGADVFAVLEQVGRKRVAQGVAADLLGDPGGLDGELHGALSGGLVEVVASPMAGFGIDVGSLRGEDPLPAPLAAREGVFAVDGVWELDPAGIACEVAPVEELGSAELFD